MIHMKDQASFSLTFYAVMNSSVCFDSTMGWSIVYIEGSQIIISNIYFLANSVDPGEMLHYAANMAILKIDF